MDILSLQWSEWEPLIKSLLYDRPILREVNDLIIVSHEQVPDFVNVGDLLRECYILILLKVPRRKAGPRKISL